MSFMQPEIYETDYIEVDGPVCTEIIPCDVDNFDVPEIVNFPKREEHPDMDRLVESRRITRGIHRAQYVSLPAPARAQNRALRFTY